MALRSGFSYWPLRNGLLATYPSLDRDETADVTIIGAGITGALAAYELTHAGANVVVVDKRDVVSGSSAATTGLLLCETDTSLLELSEHLGERAAARAYHLGLEAISRIESLTVSLADSCGFARRPSLYLASGPDAASTLEREYALRRAHGIGVELLDSADLQRRWGIDTPNALYSGGAEIDCFRFAHRLLAAAGKRGARIYDRTTVEDLRQDESGIAVVVAGGHRIRTDWVAATIGYEVADYIRPPATELSSTWACISEPLDRAPWAERCLIWESARPYLYARTTDDNRILVGGEDEPYAEEHANGALMAEKTERLVQRMCSLMPGLTFEVAYAWAGTFGWTTDGLPLIGTSSQMPRLWYSLGYGGNGITFSVVAARLLTEAYVRRSSSDATIFALDRPSLSDTLHASCRSPKLQLGPCG
jgi:glycine/D-amino acid oxidase-like deaminating enzyme